MWKKGQTMSFFLLFIKHFRSAFKSTKCKLQINVHHGVRFTHCLLQQFQSIFRAYFLYIFFFKIFNMDSLFNGWKTKKNQQYEFCRNNCRTFINLPLLELMFILKLKRFTTFHPLQVRLIFAHVVKTNGKIKNWTLRKIILKGWRG